MPPTIRVWSDYVCPYCYVGLDRSRWLAERYGAVVQPLPFYLHPEYPEEGIPRAAFDERYGARVRDAVRESIRAASLPYTPAAVIPNTLKALRVAELARDAGVHDRLHPRLFEAYWAEGRDIGAVAVLVELAAEVGLGEAEVRAALDEPRYEQRVLASTEAALDAGVGGVPAFLVDERLVVPGAQPCDVFERVLARLGHEPVRDEEPPVRAPRASG